MSTSHHTSHTLRGVCYALMAVFLFSVTNALVKGVGTTYPMAQIVFFRFFCALLPAFLFLPKKSAGDHTPPWRHVFGGRTPLIALGGVLTFASLCSLFKGFSLLPLGDATVLSFSTILFATLLSPVIVREKVSLLKWCAIGAGFVGIWMMAKPSGDLNMMGVLCAIGFGVGDSVVMLLTRILTRTEKSVFVVFGFSLVATVCAFLSLLFFWTPIHGSDLGIFVVLGLCGFAGQYCLTEGYRFAPPSVIAPMIYTGMLWGALFGYVFWHEMPDMTLVWGGMWIMGSGLGIIFLDKRQGKGRKKRSDQDPLPHSS